MKTLHFPENYDLCRPSPIVGSENSNNNSNSIANTHGHSSKTVKSSSRVGTYGNNSIEQSTKFEKNANEFQLKQQQQEQNKKRKRDTGEYFSSFLWNFLILLVFFSPILSFLHMSSISHSYVSLSLLSLLYALLKKIQNHTYVYTYFLRRNYFQKLYIHNRFSKTTTTYSSSRHHWTF